MMNNDKNSIISCLKQDPVKNANMLYFMENYPIISLERINNSVILRGKSDQVWVYLSCPNEAEFSQLLERLTPDDRHFAIIEDWMMPYLTTNRQVTWKLTTIKLFLPDSIVFKNDPEAKISVLTTDDAQTIYENSIYKEFSSVEYFQERIQNGPSAGVREDGRLVAWVMTHDDGAIGALHVLDNYRKRGFAYQLTVEIVDKVRQQGKIPFIHIEKTNTKSMNLALKLGFQKDRRVHWFELE